MPVFLSHDFLTKNIKGVIQVGIGEGGDESIWRSAKIKNQIYIEPYQPWFNNLVNRTNTQKMPDDNVRCFNVALSNFDGHASLHICNQLDSHSLAPLYQGRDAQFQWMNMHSTVQVEVTTLDTLVAANGINLNNYNLLHLDTQCTEHLVIEGAEKSLPYFDVIMVEICKVKVYEGAMLFNEWSAFMDQRGFDFVHFCEIPDIGAGDGVFVRKTVQFQDQGKQIWI